MFVLFRSFSNGVYKLKNNDSLEEYQVYCHMTEISGCGTGGWTLVMKIDGNKVKVILKKWNFNQPNGQQTVYHECLKNALLNFRLSSTIVHLTGPTRGPTQLKTDLKV